MKVKLNPVHDEKLQLVSSKGTEIGIADAGSYYTGEEVETALQEIGAGTTLDSRYVNVTGDTMNGPLLITPITDDPNVYKVTDKDGNQLFNVDTSTDKITIGSSATYIEIDASNNTFKIYVNNILKDTWK